MMQTRTLSGATDVNGDLTIIDGDLAKGMLQGIHCNLSDLDAGGDSTITVTKADGGHDDIALLTLTNDQTDAMHIPSPGAVTDAGVAISDSYPPFPFSGKFKVVIAQGGNAKSADYTFYFDDLRT